MAIGSTNVGGAGLSFKVLGFPSLEALPEKAQENSIAVITDLTITDWTVSPVAPAEPVEGDVWINTSVASRIKMRMVKRKNLFTTPSSASQFIGDKWVAKPMRIYQNKSWAEQRITLFGEGTDNPSIGNCVPWQGSSFSKTGTEMKMYCHNEHWGGFNTTKAINIAGFKYLKFWVTNTGGNTDELSIYTDEKTIKTVKVHTGWNTVNIDFNDSVFFKFTTHAWQTSGVYIGVSDHDDLPAIYLE